MQEIAVQSQPLTQLPYGLVEVEDLSVCFSDKRQNTTTVLDKINFTVKPGSFVCLLGPSGCGKSTVLNTIAGFINPTEGQILVDEQAVTKPGADRGFVFQQYSLLPWKTVFQNVEFGLKIKGIAKAKRRELVAEYLNRVGLYNRRDSFPHQLSGGMKQRASIVRALINSPSVLLMDEPFSNLDVDHDRFRLRDSRPRRRNLRLRELHAHRCLRCRPLRWRICRRLDAGGLGHRPAGDKRHLPAALQCRRDREWQPHPRQSVPQPQPAL